MEEGGLLARPKLAYEFSDQWMGRVGADILVGSGGVFGLFAANYRLHAEIERSFYIYQIIVMNGYLPYN